jgi:hypothetical protein
VPEIARACLAALGAQLRVLKAQTLEFETPPTPSALIEPFFPKWLHPASGMEEPLS